MLTNKLMKSPILIIKKKIKYEIAKFLEREDFSIVSKSKVPNEA